MNSKIDIIKQFNVPSNGHLRVDCPFCGHKNTFSISDLDGRIVWHCFSASCGERGSINLGRSVSSLRQKLLGKQALLSTNFALPNYLVPIRGRDACLKYLTSNNAIEAYLDDRAKVLYDPKQNRCVFVLTKDGEPIDAAGRALTKGTKPKWYRYGDSGEGFLCQSKVPSNTCVVVEDCASACAVSSVAHGFALLGTNMMDTHVSVLKGFDRVLVALDKDATKKGVDIARRLTYLTRSRALRLEEDIKYLSEAAVRDLIQSV